MTGRLRRHAEEGREEGKRGSKGFTLIELMVVLLIIGILMAIAIPTYLGERARANQTAAQTTVRNAMTAVNAVYAEENAYEVPPSAGTGTTFAAYMQLQEPSLKWVGSGGTVNALNQVSEARITSLEPAGSTNLSQGIELTAWAANGTCWTAAIIQQSSSTLPSGTYYKKSTPSAGGGTGGGTGGCAASSTAPATAGNWAMTWGGTPLTSF